jgi:hypothetical protein
LNGPPLPGGVRKPKSTKSRRCWTTPPIPEAHVVEYWQLPADAPREIPFYGSGRTAVGSHLQDRRAVDPAVQGEWFSKAALRNQWHHPCVRGIRAGEGE